MKTIHKYPVNPGMNTVQIPVFCKFLHFGYQPEKGLQVWALVNTDLPLFNHTVRVVGTGWDTSGLEEFNYLGTCQLKELDRDLVFHAFWLPANKEIDNGTPRGH